MRIALPLFVASWFAFLAVRSDAQDVPRVPGPPRFIDISVQYTIRLPVKGSDSQAQQDVMEQGRKLLYEMSNSECALINATISTECRLERLNVQGNLMRQRGEEDAVTLSANAQYKAKLKEQP